MDKSSLITIYQGVEISYKMPLGIYVDKRISRESSFGCNSESEGYKHIDPNKISGLGASEIRLIYRVAKDQLADGTLDIRGEGFTREERALSLVNTLDLTRQLLENQNDIQGSSE